MFCTQQILIQATVIEQTFAENLTLCVPCVILQCVNMTLYAPCVILQCVNVTLCVPCVILQCVNVTCVPCVILQCVNDQRDAQFL